MGGGGGLEGGGFSGSGVGGRFCPKKKANGFGPTAIGFVRKNRCDGRRPKAVALNFQISLVIFFWKGVKKGPGAPGASRPQQPTPPTHPARGQRRRRLGLAMREGELSEEEDNSLRGPAGVPRTEGTAAVRSGQRAMPWYLGDALVCQVRGRDWQSSRPDTNFSFCFADMY